MKDNDNSVDSLVDIGVNLTNSAFDADREQVIEQARKAGVSRLIITGTTVEESVNAAELAEKKTGCFSTAGVHPHYAQTVSGRFCQELRDLLSRKRVVAIGETGLDFNRNFSPKSAQEAVFEQHLELAVELGKPLFCHERDASRRFIEMIKPCRDQLPDIVVHCFTAGREALYPYLDLDCHIGITGWICDERRGTHLHSLVRDIPANRLMVETDAPYLLPRSLADKPKNQRNAPCFLPQVVSTIAHHTGKSFTQVASETTETALRFFRLDQDEQ